MPQWDMLVENFEKWRGAIAITIGALVLLFALRVLAPLLRRRKRDVRDSAHPTLDVSTLSTTGPLPLPRLEVYHLPMRLAAVILAPLGRGHELPPENKWEAILEHLVPGMEHVLRGHRPRRLAWPVQLSSQGFARSFNANIPLPGDHGKGSPWCVVTGRFDADGRNYAVALVLCAERDNNLAQFFVERSEQWLDVLRLPGHR